MSGRNCAATVCEELNKMRNKSTTYKIYMAVCWVVLIFSVVLRSIACIRELNYDTGYYNGSPLPKIADAAIVAASVFAISFIFSGRSDRALIPNFSSPINYLGGGVLSAALVFFATNAIGDALLARDYIIKVENSYLSEIVDLGSSYFELWTSAILAALAIVSILYFVFSATLEKARSRNRALSGLVIVVFLALYAATLYFSRNVPLNSPAKIADQMAYLFAAIFFLYETRISIGREKWHIYSAFGMIAMLLSAYSSIPSLIVYFINGQVISKSIYETALTLTLFIFISGKMLLIPNLQIDAESPTVNLIREAARKRSDELSEAAEAAKTPEEEAVAEPEAEAESVAESHDDYYSFDPEQFPNDVKAAEDGEETETSAE